MSKIAFHEAVEKLDKMVSKRFDVNVKFVSAQSRQTQDVIFYETVRRNAGAPLIITHNNMLIPVRVEGSLVGAVRVSEIQRLKPVEISRIKETIDLVMEESFIAKTFPNNPELDELDSNILPFKKTTGDAFATAN